MGPTSFPLWPFLVLVLGASLLLSLHNLDHTGLTRWDEVFHAVVARNVYKHPFQPTLVDVPYLPYDVSKWGENHIWLHKPILPFWQIALSFAAFGVNTFALRLPSALLSVGAAGLTYLLGKELFDRPTAFIAAAVQSMSPFLVKLVQGYQFADHIDIALLFWVELGIYFLARALRTGSLRYVLLAGIAQGLAFLCKSYLAFILFGLALTAWTLPLCRLGKREDCQIGLVRLAGLAGMTLLTALPWTVFCLMEYPREFWQEHAQVLRHLNTNIEGWGAPWDRVAFDYLIAIHGVFYTPILVAGIALLGKAVMEKHSGLWLAYAWSFGVVLPHLFAATKTPSATVLAMPALFLLLGCLITEAFRRRPWPLAALTAILALSVFLPAGFKNPGYGSPTTNEFGAIMWQSLWVIGHVFGALEAAAIVVMVMIGARMYWPASGSVGRYLCWVAQAFSTGVLIWLGIQAIGEACRITGQNINDPTSVEVGAFVNEHLPPNAVLLCEDRRGDEHVAIMFYADRSCYAAGWSDLDGLARRVEEAGGIPYFVSYRRLSLPAVYVSAQPGPTLYRWKGP